MKADLIVRAELSGDDTASALGITVKSGSPVLALCRKLVEAGHNPANPLEAYRGDTLCLRVRSIGVPAGLEIPPPWSTGCVTVKACSWNFAELAHAGDSPAAVKSMTTSPVVSSLIRK